MINPVTPSYKSLIASCPNQLQATDWNQLEIVEVEGPSYNGITNTRSMAKLAAIMANYGKPLPGNERSEPVLLNNKTLEILGSI